MLFLLVSHYNNLIISPIIQLQCAMSNVFTCLIPMCENGQHPIHRTESLKVDREERLRLQTRSRVELHWPVE